MLAGRRVRIKSTPSQKSIQEPEQHNCSVIVNAGSRQWVGTTRHHALVDRVSFRANQRAKKMYFYLINPAPPAFHKTSSFSQVTHPHLLQTLSPHLKGFRRPLKLLFSLSHVLKVFDKGIHCRDPYQPREFHLPENELQPAFSSTYLHQSSRLRWVCQLHAPTPILPHRLSRL